MRIGYDLYVNVNLRMCAVNQACAQRVGESREAKANAGKHEGEPGLPFKVCLYALFCFSGGLLLFLATWPFTAFLSGPHAGPRANVFF